MKHFLKLAYKLGADQAQLDFMNAAPLMGLLPKTEAQFLRGLAAPPVQPLQPQQEEEKTLTPERLKQLGQLSRLMTVSSNPAMKLTGRLLNKTLTTAATTHEDPNAPAPPQSV